MEGSKIDIIARFGKSPGFNAERTLRGMRLPPPPPKPEEKIYTFTAPDTEENIVFLPQMVDGKPVVKGGTLEKLVERLTYEKYPDPVYTQNFLLTYRTFTTPNHLLQILRARFNMKPPPNMETAEFEKTLKPIRLRVFNVLKNWLLKGFYDFVENNKLRLSLLQFIKEDISVSMANAADSLIKVYDRQMSEAKQSREVVFSKKPPVPIIPKNLSSEPTLLDFHPEEIARQLTIIESELYRAIKPWEFLGQAWAKKDKDKRAPRVLAMINRFNLVSTWVATEVVQAETLKQRLAVLRQVIDVANYCRQLNNFNGMMEVISGLQSSPIYRLKQTWGALDRSHTKLLDELHEVMSRDQNFKNFRSHLHSSDPPCIPYLGVYLTDLTFIEDGNSDELKGGLINFVKRQQVSQVINEIQQYQNSPYCLEKVHFIADWLSSVEPLDEEGCYKLSLERESRGGGTPTSSKKSDAKSEGRKRGLTRTTSTSRNSVKEEELSDSPFASPYGELEDIKGYKFYEKDSDKNIQVVMEDDREVIKGGTLPKLVERLTFEKYPDTNFLSAFMMSYKTFTTSNELLDLLIMRFNMPCPKAPNKEQEKRFKNEKLIPIHFRVFNVLKTWVDKYIQDFKQDTVLVQRVLDFVDKSIAAHPVLEKAGKQIRQTLSKRLELPSVTVDQLVRLGDEYKPGVEVPADIPRNILNLDAGAVADQIFVISRNCILNVESREALQKLWISPESKKKSPHLRILVQNHEQLGLWCQSEIVKAPDVTTRTEVINWFLTMAERFSRLKDFHDCHAIIQSIEEIRDKLLGPTWVWLQPKTAALYQKLCAMIHSGEWNVALLSAASKSRSTTGTIPILMPVVESVGELEDTMPDMLTAEMINFEKRQLTFLKFLPITRISSMTFPEEIEVDGQTIRFLLNLEILSPEAIQQTGTSMNNEAPEGQTPGEGGADESAHASRLQEYIRSLLEDDSELRKQLIDMLSDSVRMQVAKEIESEIVNYGKMLSYMTNIIGDTARSAECKEEILRLKFPGADIQRWTMKDTEGVVYGWPEDIVLFEVKKDNRLQLCDVAFRADGHYLNVLKRSYQFYTTQAESSDFGYTLVTCFVDDAALKVCGEEDIHMVIL